MSKSTYAIPLLQTKLHRPAVTDDVIDRRKLHAALEESRSLPLTLVVAPAGYGKSTLVSHWAEQSGYPVAWLSLEQTDNDLQVFLSYFVAAIRSVVPEACPDSAARLRSKNPPPADIMARELNNELEAIQQPVIVVLDDYHLITQPKIHDALGFQLKHWPGRLHLVIASRRDPPLPTASLRAHNRMGEIRLDDLMFSLAESDRFLSRAAPCPMDAEAVQVLHEALEGWPVGLRLSVLAMGRNMDTQGFVRGLPDTNALIQDYLLE
jgi:LuxR family maltose regulon positive regulatory protein